MDSQIGYWQHLQGQPGPAAWVSSKVVRWCLVFMRLSQTALATQVAVSTGWAVADVSCALVKCAGDCVMASDQTTDASNLLAALLALYTLAFVIAVVVVGFSIYNLIKPLFRACHDRHPISSAVTHVCDIDTESTNCTCQAGHRAELDLLIAALCVAVLELVRTGVVRGFAPANLLLESGVFLIAVTVLNITALHASLRAEQFVTPLVADQGTYLDEKEQQFIMSNAV